MLKKNITNTSKSKRSFSLDSENTDKFSFLYLFVISKFSIIEHVNFLKMNLLKVLKRYSFHRSITVIIYHFHHWVLKYPSTLKELSKVKKEQRPTF